MVGNASNGSFVLEREKKTITDKCVEENLTRIFVETPVDPGPLRQPAILLESRRVKQRRENSSGVLKSAILFVVV